MDPAGRAAPQGGARPRAESPGGAAHAAAQALHGGPAEPAEAAKHAPREGDQGAERAAGAALRREHARSHERQDAQDEGHQGGQAQGEAAEQHQEIHGGAEGRANGAEPGEGEAEAHSREADGGSTKGDEWGEHAKSEHLFLSLHIDFCITLSFITIQITYNSKQRVSREKKSTCKYISKKITLCFFSPETISFSYSICTYKNYIILLFFKLIAA